jgi:putative Mg2+ transporter-C (MgtC) family protein
VSPEFAQALAREFGDLTDAADIARFAVRLAVAVLAGAAIGWDRELRASSAGFRTHILVAAGAALFMIVPLHAGFDSADMSRVVQGLVAGIGFLGAGAILKMDDRGEIRGLTTAATIWVTAAIGMTAGLGQLVTAIVATVVVLVVLTLLPRVEPRGDDKRPAKDEHRPE